MHLDMIITMFLPCFYQYYCSRISWNERDFIIIFRRNSRCWKNRAVYFSSPRKPRPIFFARNSRGSFVCVLLEQSMATYTAPAYNDPYSPYNAVPPHSHPHPPHPPPHPYRPPQPSSLFIEKQQFPIHARFRDLWAALLFLFLIIAYITLSSVFLLPHLKLSLSFIPTSLIKYPITAISVVLLVSSLCAILFLVLIQRYPLAMIKSTLTLSVALNLCFAGYLIYARQYILGTFMLLFAVMYAWAAWTWRYRIPFTAILLSTTANITRTHPGPILVACGMVLIQIGWYLFFLASVVALFMQTNATTPRECIRIAHDQLVCTGGQPYPAVYVACVGIVFMYFWGYQVFALLVHTVACGTYATFYYQGNTTLLPRYPTLGALKRALTTSFGSVCFGSLILAVVKTVRSLVNTAADSTQDHAFSFFGISLSLSFFV